MKTRILAVAAIVFGLTAAEPAIREARTLPVADVEGVWTLAFTPDGKTLVAGASSRASTMGPPRRGEVRLLNVEDGKVRAAWFGHADCVREMAISPDGRLLATTTAADTEVLLWRLPDGAAV